MVDNAKLATMFVEIKADTQKLKSELAALKNQTKTTSTQMSSGFKAFAASAVIAGAAVIAVKAAIGFLTGSIQAFITQGKAVAKVEQAIKTTGGAAGYTSKELKNMASELQKITSIGDEKILNDVTAQLLTFTGITGDAFRRAQVAALDLAAVIGTDLKSQTIQLAKALEDPIKGITSLSRAGVTFSDKQKDLIKTLVLSGDVLGAQSIILTEIETKYGGQAEAINKVDGGLANLNSTLGDVQEVIGEDLIQSVNEGTDALQELAEGFIELNDDVKIATGGVGIFGQAIQAMKDLATGGKGILDRLFDFRGGYKKAKEDYDEYIADMNEKTENFYKDLGLGKTAPGPKISLAPFIPDTKAGDKILEKYYDQKVALLEINNAIDERLKKEQTPIIKAEIAELKKEKNELLGIKDTITDIGKERKKYYDQIGTLLTDYYKRERDNINTTYNAMIESGISKVDAEKWRVNEIKKLNDIIITEEVAKNKKILDSRERADGDFKKSIDFRISEIARLRKAGEPIGLEYPSSITKGLEEPMGLVDVPIKVVPELKLDDWIIQLKNWQDSLFTAVEFINVGIFSATDGILSAFETMWGGIKVAERDANNALIVGFVAMANAFISQVARMAAEWLAFQLIKGIATISTGGPASPLNLLTPGIEVHSGGKFLNGNKIPAFSTGGSFVVPQGYERDTFPFLAETGETVTIEPRTSGNSSQTDVLLSKLINLTLAQTKTLANKDTNIVINNNITDTTVAKMSAKGSNRLNKAEVNLNEY